MPEEASRFSEFNEATKVLNEIFDALQLSKIKEEYTFEDLVEMSTWPAPGPFKTRCIQALYLVFLFLFLVTLKSFWDNPKESLESTFNNLVKQDSHYR